MFDDFLPVMLPNHLCFLPSAWQSRADVCLILNRLLHIVQPELQAWYRDIFNS